MIVAASICYALTLFYVILMLYYSYGWILLPQPGPRESDAGMSVTVIVPARNEEKNIEALLHALKKQTYPSSHIEIIVVDDHSTDKTAAIASSFGVKLLSLTDDAKSSAYKKRAITLAIENSSGSLIVTTDADSVMGEHWIRSLVDFQKQTGAQFISAPVCMDKNSSVFEEFQALEFAGLVGIGGASIQNKRPTMCNGANVAYLRSAFQAVGGFTGHENIASGDDEFLMHAIFRHYRGGVHFLKSEDAIVYTPAATELNAFVQQRMRWVSKSTQYTDRSITTILVLCYLFNLSILVNFFLALSNSFYAWILLVQVVCKVITEGFFLFTVTSFFQKKRLLIWLIPEQLLHVVYVVVIGILGNTMKYKWKGRVVKN